MEDKRIVAVLILIVVGVIIKLIITYRNNRKRRYREMPK